MKLKKYQEEAVGHLTAQYEDGHKSLILRSDEGSGKTIMALMIAQKVAKRALFIGQAKARKDLERKIDAYYMDKELGIDVPVDIVSYHTFKDVRKLPAKLLRKYDMLIFDECQMLKKFSAGWTTRFCAIKNNEQKKLFLSATPYMKKIDELLYVLSSTTSFPNSVRDIKLEYFNTKPSRYGDFLDVGKLISEADFAAQLDTVLYNVTEDMVDESLPTTNFKIQTLKDNKALVSNKLEEYTQTCVLNGLTKVDETVELIKKDMEENDVKVALIYTRFHEVAQKVHGKLPQTTLALSSQQVRSGFERLRDDGVGVLITTLGLTNSSLDLNECDNIYMVETNESFALDRQSIRRCRRIGKKSTLNVTYFYLEGDQSFKNVIQSIKATKGGLQDEHSKMGPSSLAILEHCPGSYWLPDTSDKTRFAAAALKGTQMHEVLEDYLRDPEKRIKKVHEDTVASAARSCRKLIEKAEQFGIEDKVNYFDLHPELYGSCDFWSYSKGVLRVVDYKNGNYPVKAQDNIQLSAYCLFICETYNLKPKQIIFTIWQKNKEKSCYYDGTHVEYMRSRIKKVLEKIKKAKKNPLLHLKEGGCSPFCRAHRYHIEQKEGNMAVRKKKGVTKKTSKKPARKAATKNPRAKLTGKVFYQKESDTTISLGLSMTKLPKGLDKKYGEDIVEATFPYDEEYENYSCFSNGFLNSYRGPTDNFKGAEVSLIVELKVSKDEDRLWLNLVDIEGEPVEEDEDQEGYEDAAEMQSDGGHEELDEFFS